MLVAVTLPVHHASVALQPRQCCGRASQWSKGEEVAVMLPVHHVSSALRRGNTPGGHPSGRSREKGLLAVTLWVHHASIALQLRQHSWGASQWSE
jgi:hypothetical protein